ncbi:FkbM family methyltransferase [Leptothoe sp. LEGE 181152]|nr:FkbM family methyltransferase [Leptothoe sp. LEGE 181152]
MAKPGRVVNVTIPNQCLYSFSRPIEVMNLLGILKPEYLYQPEYLYRRLLNVQSDISSEFADLSMPCDLKIRVRPLEEHGKALATLGVVDLVTSEALWRLTDPGEISLDVGANIGYMSAILAARTALKSGGKVYAFEAHPEIFEELSFNLKNWQTRLSNVTLISQQVALSDRIGVVHISEPLGFDTNRGLASIAFQNADSVSQPEIENISVKSTSLDTVLPDTSIGVMKLDVEGHELNVLKGTANLLRQHKIRDCIFEEHNDYPTSVTQYFEEWGYSIFRLKRNFYGPSLVNPHMPVSEVRWLPKSLLATCQPKRAIRRFERKGWKILSR